MKFNSSAALSSYRNTGLQGVVEQASPHELIRLLMDGALDRIAVARGQLERNEIAAKGASIGRAIGILEGLRNSLDMEAGDGEISNNLDRLYDYMMRRLMLANVNNDAEPLDEVHELLSQIRDAWIEVGASPAEVPAAAVAV